MLRGKQVINSKSSLSSLGKEVLGGTPTHTDRRLFLDMNTLEQHFLGGGREWKPQNFLEGEAGDLEIERYIESYRGVIKITYA